MDAYRELRETIEKIELFDGHSHNIVSLDSSFPFIKCFTEADDHDALSFAQHTLSFKRGVREIAALYGCESTLQSIEDYRKKSGLESVATACFGAARFSGLLIDDGLDFDKICDIDWHKTVVPFVGVGLKSIAAYRGGLEIDTNVSEKDAEDGLSEVLSAGKPVRIANKKLIDYIFTLSLEDLRTSNPLHLRMLLEDERFSKCRLVLLHTSYPFSKEASYLASVYPQVYLDFGLGLLLLSNNGMKTAVKELLELAPLKKVMFSTDAYAFPEAFYLGAKRAREVIFSVLKDACIGGDLSIAEALEAAKDLFAENAIQFYKINLSGKSNLKTNTSPNPGNITEIVPKSNITLVRVLWVDTSGQCRCRVVPIKRFHDVSTKNGVGLTFASMGMTSFMDGPAAESNLTGTGEIRLIPDLATQRTIPWGKGEEMVLADMHLRPGEPWEYCPREALRRVGKVLKEEFNLELEAGFENEFYLLKPVNREGKEDWTPFDSTPYCSTSAYDAAAPILHEMFDALQSLDITVEQLHAEAGKGQFEMALGHTICINAADNLVFAREAIRAVARKHGLLATMTPKYALDDIGSGSHVHLSLWENGVNVFTGAAGSKHGMSKVGEEFMAGVLSHLPALLAFTAPNPNRQEPLRQQRNVAVVLYDRIQPNTWSGAYQCWGKENREAPLRTACPPGIPDGLVSNFEIKSFDGCTNPFLGLASIIAAGIDGLRKHLTLPLPIVNVLFGGDINYVGHIDCDAEANPSSLDGELRRLPTNLSESLDALEKDTIFEELLGKNLLTAIKGVRKAV
ncbi:hypothetical protein KSS87_015916 [Heliosperma pusillum]|nr:hypothetical protein KSS87_015916 [Heliosperma pusillum]